MTRVKRKFGNPNNSTVKAFRGTTSEALRAKRLNEKKPAGQQDDNRLVSYDQHSVRAALDAQLCPFCGAGPYKVVATHASMSHGVSARELRKYAGLPQRSSICSPENSQRRAEILNGRPDRDEMTRRGNARSVEEGSHHEATAARSAMRKADSAERDQLVLRLFGEDELLRDIAEKVGVARNTVKKILERNGINLDARTRRAQVASEKALWGNKARKVSVEDHEEILRLYTSGETQTKIGQLYGLSQTRVGQIIRANRSRQGRA